jgi:NAD(P)-dependent dehydrogenase (short-subunit alcohol dehydrogenase family)
MKLEGRRVLITGASRGLGLAIATACVAEGAHTAICARTKADVDAAVSQLEAKRQPAQIVMGEPADVSDPEQVKAWVERATSTLGGVDVLVGNAGVYGPMGTLDDVDLDAWWKAVSINLLGNVLLLKHVIPHLKAQKYGKIVLLSGGGATQPLPNISAYAASKAGLVRLAETVAGELRPYRVDVNTVAPGALDTRMLDEVLQAGPDKVGKDFYERNVKLRAENKSAPLELGAQLVVYLASSASDGITGKLVSAVWDPWKDLARFREALSSSDIYTLRRIVPEDRGQSWK